MEFSQQDGHHLAYDNLFVWSAGLHNRLWNSQAGFAQYDLCREGELPCAGVVSLDIRVSAL